MNRESTSSLTSDVLFQRIGNNWFVFCEVNNEVIYSQLPEGIDPKTTKLELYHVIEEHLGRVYEYRKKSAADQAA